jgi:Gpi18-like mannosyltransferase
MSSGFPDARPPPQPLADVTQAVRSPVRDRWPPAGTVTMMAAALVLGLGLRLSAWSYATLDTTLYLKPWYAYARDHGWSALRVGFTNYTPFYSYLLIAVTGLDGRAPSLLLIKSISFVFELATAITAYRFVARATGSRVRAGAALAAAWLAPAVLYNGALWGQADSIWTFFIVLAVYGFSTGRNGALPFAMGFAVKAQAVFLGPYVLGMILRQRCSLLWLAAPPLAYLAIAAPVLLAGRPLSEVVSVYAGQAATFRVLSMNAASMWVLAPSSFYDAGVLIGVGAAATAGLAISVLIARSPRTDIEFGTVAACLSLLAMPFLLPKMHDRYFYAFEVVSIVLACLNPRYLLVALVAQVSALFSYQAYDQENGLAVPVAAVQNLLLAGFLTGALVRPGGTTTARPRAIVEYLALATVVGCLLPLCKAPHPNLSAFAAFLVISVAMLIRLGQQFFRMSRPPAAPMAAAGLVAARN